MSPSLESGPTCVLSWRRFVFIFLSNGSKILIFQGVYKCGASLISPNFLLTAAHCFDSSIASPGTIVRCGDWDTLTDAELYPFQERGVRQVAFHPGFDTERGARGNLRNDIAVIQTDKTFLLAPHVDTICLPEPGENFDGSLCAATGWGKDRFGLCSDL